MKAAALQIAILDPLKVGTMEDVAQRFLKEAEKVFEKLFGDREVAEAVAQDEVRSFHFFTAVVCLTAIACLENRELARAFGFKRSLLGKWRRVGD